MYNCALSETKGANLVIPTLTKLTKQTMKGSDFMAKSLHFSIDIISRGKGQSVVNSSAYISGDKLYNEYDGQTYGHTRKERVLYKDILLPKHIPKQFRDRQFLWNSVERAEKNSNAQLARQF